MIHAVYEAEHRPSEATTFVGFGRNIYGRFALLGVHDTKKGAPQLSVLFLL